MDDSGQGDLSEKLEQHSPKGIASGEPRDPAGFLLRALGTAEPEKKRSFAEQGIRALSDDDEEEIHALLLRQVYLADIEEGHDLQALDVASQIIELGTLGEIARQDAARAAMGARNIGAAIGHVTIAARVCPPERRAFHYGHLGALLRFNGQEEEAISALEKALRWATSNRVLYQAQKALAQVASGAQSENLGALRQRLESEPTRPAYALWVLGELCLLSGDANAGKVYLQQFLTRQDGAPRAKNLALRGEIDHATALLEQLSA